MPSGPKPPVDFHRQTAPLCPPRCWHLPSSNPVDFHRQPPPPPGRFALTCLELSFPSIQKNHAARCTPGCWLWASLPRNGHGLNGMGTKQRLLSPVAKEEIRFRTNWHVPQLTSLDCSEFRGSLPKKWNPNWHVAKKNSSKAQKRERERERERERDLPGPIKLASPQVAFAFRTWTVDLTSPRAPPRPEAPSEKCAAKPLGKYSMPKLKRTASTSPLPQIPLRLNKIYTLAAPCELPGSFILNAQTNSRPDQRRAVGNDNFCDKMEKSLPKD